MKKLFTIICTALFLAVSCDRYEDILAQLRDHEQRIEQLEKECRELNSNVQAIQTSLTAILQNDYITEVMKIMENGVEIGYSLTFAKGGTVTIYHGTDGSNGSTPQIGIKKASDGAYYWTANGEWLTGEGGNMIPATVSDPNSGYVVPQFRIADDVWYISYDNGNSWRQIEVLNKTEEPIFVDVDITNPDCVIITLADGTEIKIPTWKAFEELQQIINQVNDNVTALQEMVTALQQNDYVTSVSPLVENGKIIGYLINFSQSGNVVIYHGQDGTDGQNGKTPVISIKQDTDDIYYWTVDGEWIMDSEGNKIPTTGKEGEEGENGITPQFKIEEGYWYISYDMGKTWSKLGEATGDSFFKSVSQDEYYVYLTLSDGTAIQLPTATLVEEIRSRTSEVRLANRYDLVVGDTFQLFYTGAVKTFNIENEGLRVVCSVGQQMPRYFEYTPTEADAGKSYKLTITTRRFDGSVISEGETTLYVHPKLTNITTPSHLNMLIFGDSLTSGGRWAGEGLRRVYGTDMSVKPQSLGVTNTCTTYGTKNALINGYSVYHEGYGGWTWDSFLKLNEVNPFYNPDEGIVDFKYHAAKYNNRGADVVAVLLTGNGAGIAKDFNHQARIDKHMASAATMLRKIHSDFPTAKIICLGQLVCNNKGGMGTNYGATGTYSDPYATLFYLFDFSKSLEQLVTNEEFSEYCYYVDNKAQFDVDYNLPYKNEPVNSRNDSVTEVEGTNGLHPTNAGYHQIGDAFYRALHRVLPTIGGNEDLGNSEGEW